MNNVIAKGAPNLNFSGHYRVLLVDDSKDIRDIEYLFLKQQLEKYLKDHHNTVDTVEIQEAGSAEQALEMLKKAPVDLMITDHRMPNIGDGIALLKAIQNTPFKPKAAIMHSSDSDIKDKAIQTGAQGFFTKGQGTLEAIQFAVDYLSGLFGNGNSQPKKQSA